jgi:hypothetical protein
VKKTLFRVASAALFAVTAMLMAPTAASAADVYEKKTVTAGSLPSRIGSSDCVQTTGAKVCYDEVGDNWWVQDTAADGASAKAMWTNWLDGQLDPEPYRWGSCTNSLGSGKWGYCAHDYYEGSSLNVQPAVWNLSADVAVRFGPYKNFTA